MKNTQNTLKHPATLATHPRRYLIAATTAAKVAADLAAKEAGKEARKAATAERNARKAEKRAALANTPEAANLARAARAAADLAATEAANARAAAVALAADPAAYVAAATIEARTPAEAHATAARRFEEAAARGMLAPLADIRAYIDPRAALEARAATEAPRAALEAAKAAYLVAPEAAKPEAAAKVTEARAALAEAEKTAKAAEAAVLAEAPEAVARQVAKKSTEREGTPTQWDIRRAAEAREHFDFDFFPMVSAARDPLAAILYGNEAKAAALEAEAAATLEAAKSPDRFTRESISRERLTEARAALRVAAVIREKEADPAAPFWILSAYRAAFLSVNDHLTACRSIRTSEAPAPLSLADLDPEAPTLAVDFDPEAEKEAAARAATLRAAFAKVAATLTPTRRRVWVLMGKGYTPEAIAAKMKRNHPTICEHQRSIRIAAAIALTNEAPDLAATLRAAAIIEEAAALEKEADKARRLATDKAAAALVTQAATAQEEAAKAAKAAKAADLEAATAPATAAAATLAAAVAALSPIRREIWARLAKGQSGREIAREMGRNEATTREHIKATRAALAAAMEATAPELAEALKAADLATIAAALEK